MGTGRYSGVAGRLQLYGTRATKKQRDDGDGGRHESASALLASVEPRPRLVASNSEDGGGQPFFEKLKDTFG